MAIESEPTPEWHQRSMLGDLEVCLSCFALQGKFRGREHRCSCMPRDDTWRSRVWEGYDIPAHVDLCRLCARNTMQSGSRWTWFVCDTCLGVNRTVGAVLGSGRAGALPLGRHSLMNGITLSNSDLGDAGVGYFKNAIRGLGSIWRRLLDWQATEATRLLSTVSYCGPGMALNDWLDLFPESKGASVDAYCRFVEYDLPQHADLRVLSAERLRFLQGDRPQSLGEGRPEWA